MKIITRKIIALGMFLIVCGSNVSLAAKHKKKNTGTISNTQDRIISIIYKFKINRTYCGRSEWKS
jgi:hypothetical protein